MLSPKTTTYILRSLESNKNCRRHHKREKKTSTKDNRIISVKDDSTTSKQSSSSPISIYLDFDICDYSLDEIMQFLRHLEKEEEKSGTNDDNGETTLQSIYRQYSELLCMESRQCFHHNSSIKSEKPEFFISSMSSVPDERVKVESYHNRCFISPCSKDDRTEHIRNTKFQSIHVCEKKKIIKNRNPSRLHHVHALKMGSNKTKRKEIERAKEEKIATLKELMKRQRIFCTHTTFLAKFIPGPIFTTHFFRP